MTELSEAIACCACCSVWKPTKPKPLLRPSGFLTTETEPSASAGIRVSTRPRSSASDTANGRLPT